MERSPTAHSAAWWVTPRMQHRVRTPRAPGFGVFATNAPAAEARAVDRQGLLQHQVFGGERIGMRQTHAARCRAPSMGRCLARRSSISTKLSRVRSGSEIEPRHPAMRAQLFEWS